MSVASELRDSISCLWMTAFWGGWVVNEGLDEKEERDYDAAQTRPY